MNYRSLEQHKKNRQRKKKQAQQRKKNQKNIIIILLVMIVVVMVIVGISSCVSDWVKREQSSVSDTQSSEIYAQKSTENKNDIPDNGDDGYYLNEDIFVWNRQAFELFHGNQKNAETYASLINHCSQRLPETVENVYSMVIPSHIALGLPERLINTVQSNNQQEYIRQIYQHYDSSVKSISVFDTLDKHKREYIFFRTDHRWTTLGSYYAYEQFCSSADLSPIPLNNRTYTDIPSFIGSMYAVTNLEILKNNADTLRYYDIDVDYRVRIQKTKNSSFKTYDSIYNLSARNTADAYQLFLYGDNPVTQITCPDVSSNHKLLVIKDSYGNDFISWLIGHYREIHVIDFTSYEGNIPYYCKNNTIDTVLFLNDVMSSVNSFQIDHIASVF